MNDDLRLERVTVRTYRVRTSRFAPTKAVRLDPTKRGITRMSGFGVPAARGDRRRHR